MLFSTGLTVDIPKGFHRELWLGLLKIPRGRTEAAALGSDCGTMQIRVKHLTAIPFSPGSGRQEGNDKGMN